MNVFVLDEDKDKAARALVDKHVSKMTLEAVQICNTGLHHADKSEFAFYGATHKNHPWCEFAARSFDHFTFVYDHARALGREYERRYDDIHTSHFKALKHWDYRAMDALEREMSRCHDVWPSVPQTMLDEYVQDDPIEAYRDYYIHEKLTQDWAKYDHTEPPHWLVEDTPMNRWI